MYAYIPDTVVLSVGDLPESAVRLDTGQLITDLAGSNSRWARACGYYDVDDPDLAGTLATSALTADEQAMALYTITLMVAELDARQTLVESADTDLSAGVTANAVFAAATPSVAVQDQLDEQRAQLVALGDQIESIAALLDIFADTVLVPPTPPPPGVNWTDDFDRADGLPGDAYHTGRSYPDPPGPTILSGQLVTRPRGNAAWITRTADQSTTADQYIKAVGVGDLSLPFRLGICQDTPAAAEMAETDAGLEASWLGDGFYTVSAFGVALGTFGDGSITSGAHDVEWRREDDVYTLLVDGVTYDTTTDPSPPAFDDTYVYQRFWFLGPDDLADQTIDALEGGNYPP